MWVWSDITAVQDYEMHYLNAWLNRCVFNLDLDRVSEPRTLSGRLFQSLGAKYEKAPLPPLVDFAILSTSVVKRPCTSRDTLPQNDNFVIFLLPPCPCMQNKYSLLYQLGHKGTLFALKSERKSTKTTHPCVEANIEVYTFWVQGIISKMALHWHRGDVKVLKCWIKSLFLFYFHTKIFSSLHNIMIEPLMADGVSWWCFSYSGPWQCNLLGSQWDSYKPPGSHPKYLKLCSEDEQCFYRFGMTWG